MKMREFFRSLIAVTYLMSIATASRPQLYSTRMIDSIVSRKQGIEDSGAASSILETGFLAQAIQSAIVQYPQTKSRYNKYLIDVLDTASSRGLTNTTFALTKPLDRFSLSMAIHSAVKSKVVQVTSQSLKAHDAIAASLRLQRRNPDGGLWYYVYPEWSYLDGVFSLLPYMATMDKVDYQDMMLQINLLFEHCVQPDGLLVHGYDWSRKAVWANTRTGASPLVWGRSLGWFITGLVQTWDQLSCQSVNEAHLLAELCNLIESMTNRVAAAIIRHADPKTGAWWQLVTHPYEKGNYLESSSTALFIFSLLKANRIGLLYYDNINIRGVATKAYEYTIQEFIIDTGNNTIGLDKTVSVCSLNSTATYEYYTTRPILPNSLLGESAFILASLEMELLGQCV